MYNCEYSCCEVSCEHSGMLRNFRCGGKHFKGNNHGWNCIAFEISKICAMILL